MNVQTLINLVITGITLGAIYVLMAFGLTFVYGITKVFNYAQGSFFTWGGYIAWFLLSRSLPVNYLVVVVITLIFMFVMGLVFEKVIIYPLRRQPDWDFTVIIVTLGCALALDNLALAAFGPMSKKLPFLLEGTFTLGKFAVGKHDVVVLLAAIAILAALGFFLGKTREGMAMRAVAQDTTGGKIVGLSVDKLYSYSFGISAALGALAAILLAPRTLLYPLVGWATLLKSFTVIVMGGLGNIKGTVIAAFILAIVEVFATYLVGGIWALPILLLLLIGVLEIKPKGLFGTW